ncbi:MAG: hypothetical protein LBI08_01440 [Methanomassiliicoccaceae archaeon]|jgi:hypothetical protein|nr:hypothetical protein [Methanomassiliicoccaceae archaeon]
MATSSFYEILEIKTEEQVKALLKAFEDADNRPPEEPMTPTIDELLERSRRLMKEGFF